ncbi:uncharacterized, partial [Tachysurus ichikawai]
MADLADGRKKTRMQAKPCCVHSCWRESALTKRKAPNVSSSVSRSRQRQIWGFVFFLPLVQGLRLFGVIFPMIGCESENGS